ncbi:bifunctional DNA primase/polymerase [Streptomyces alkaliterrae]|uniref:DNA primase n=1 Tax=Streptomyces alkaliterrae TaxID=2213162 RepID=A0A5P0YW53_9ACTN|nr:bifunctional DNA primase/polymerase [Streptomyces alkaliterrae]MBB1256147.1 bifunctional DNA primase/polymerase [Streptomyces alkaliterrae]MBB1257262.1 bifunctional DNA primase/polymerase [Streptomyces alkaliterrae]MQS03712.1 DNA primase [Streptomyces alkaliterrae]
MGFTIGGIREFRELRLGARRYTRPRRPGRESEQGALAEYTGLWGWDVVPGARRGRDGCSCGAGGCPAPGAHPLDASVEITAGTTVESATRLWDDMPPATLLLPTGRSFDVLDVPAAAGRRALVRLERMGLPLGPVALAPHGRAWFFVAPGAAAELPDLLYRMGWEGIRLDLRCRGRGDHITAPPSDFAGLGPVGWLRPPTLECAGRPPQARLLLGTLAYVCHRSVPTAR